MNYNDLIACTGNESLFYIYRR